MLRHVVAAMLVCFCAGAPAFAQTDTPPDRDSGSRREAVEVRLVLVEALVIDEEGSPVPDLTLRDFQLDVGGMIRPIETLDVSCPDHEPQSTGETAVPSEAEAVVPTEAPSRIVFAVDYLHLDHHDRTKVLERLAEMISSDTDLVEHPIMIVALADLLRIEQRFTEDRSALLDTLHRMDYDRTLFSVDATDNTGQEWFELLSTLMDVLEVYDGPKAVLLISPVEARPDVRQEWFDDVYDRASAARASIYPSFARWMKFDEPRQGMYRPKGHAGGQRILPALANGTGGRMPPNSDDLFFALERAELDLSCRYTVGFEVDSDVAASSMDINLQVMRPGVSVYYPSSSRVRSEEERRLSRLRAAFADPEALDSPLVRAQAIPLRPVNGKTWQTLLAVQFPVPPEVGEAGFEVRASLAGEDPNDEAMIQRRFPVSSPAGDEAPVTVIGDSPLETGSHTLTVALSEPGRGEVVTTQTRLDVPPPPRDGVLLQGPLLARLTGPDGELSRQLADGPEASGSLETLLEHPESVEVLLVNEVNAAEPLILFWQVCTASKHLNERTIDVGRVIRRADGEIVRELPPHRFRPTGSGRTRCDGAFDPVPAGTLDPGRYQVTVAVVDADDGTELATETAPVSFR